MDEKKIEVSNSNIGFLGLLTIVLVILKAFGKISIGWLWVFAPIWIPIGLLILVFLLLAFLAVVAAFLS